MYQTTFQVAAFSIFLVFFFQSVFKFSHCENTSLFIIANVLSCDQAQQGEGFIFSLFSWSHPRRSWLNGTLALVDVYYTQYVHTHTHTPRRTLQASVDSMVSQFQVLLFLSRSSCDRRPFLWAITWHQRLWPHLCSDLLLSLVVYFKMMHHA